MPVTDLILACIGAANACVVKKAPAKKAAPKKAPAKKPAAKAEGVKTAQIKKSETVKKPAKKTSAKQPEKFNNTTVIKKLQTLKDLNESKVITDRQYQDEVMKVADKV